MAFLDTTAHALNQPLVGLLGGVSRPIPAYDSYGIIDLAADERSIRRSVEDGFRAIKIKIGELDLANDMKVFGTVRSMIRHTERPRPWHQLGRESRRQILDLLKNLPSFR